MNIFNAKLKITLLSGLIVLLFIFGGVGIKVEKVQFYGVIVALLILGLIWLQKRKIQLPRFIIPYSLFLILFLLHSLKVSVDTKKSMDIFSLFFGGGLFWVAFYNFKKEFVERFEYLIILLGTTFGFLSYFYEFFGLRKISPWSLYAEASYYYNHNHIGDLWALVLLVAIFYLTRNPKRFIYWFLVPFGVYFLIISQSRAALLSLFVGLYYLAEKSGLLRKYKKVYFAVISILVILFLYFGTQKSILLSRPYFVQALIGFFRNPQGVGVGNFDLISKDIGNHILGLSEFSSVAHNIVLEVLAGMGVLGLVFVYWLYKAIIDVWSMKSNTNIVYRTLFLALTANFLFDSTYFIPTMLWLWFAVLGLSKNED
jgi:O-antigen ligase